jgi:hypothetical protein
MSAIALCQRAARGLVTLVVVAAAALDSGVGYAQPPPIPGGVCGLKTSDAFVSLDVSAVPTSPFVIILTWGGPAGVYEISEYNAQTGIRGQPFASIRRGEANIIVPPRR